MLRRFSVNFALLSMIVDGGVVALSLFLSAALHSWIVNQGLYIDRLLSDAARETPNWVYLIFPVIWVLVLLVFSQYDGRRNFRLVDEMASLTFSSLMAAVSLSGFLYLTVRETSRSLFLIFILLTYLLLVLMRFHYRLAFRHHIFSGVQQRHILILGAGLVGHELEKRILIHEGLGLNLVGFLDDDPAKRTGDPRILGSLADTRRIITEHHVEEVVLALPARAYECINHITAELHDLPVKVWVVPDYFNLALNRARMEDVAGLPLMDLRAPALNDYQILVKRIFDITITLLGMPMVLPIMGLIALAIRLDSPGPIFFKQKRIGENGQPFFMLKFRSMITDAEKYRHVIEDKDANGRITQNKTRQDPRITRVGRFIRKTSLDELPQLINVLKGEMSLIGPRPELPYLVDQYEPWQRRRFAVPQGITGWWQVNGRSDKPMHLHTDEDLYYVQNYSIWLDIQILIKTFWTVIHHKGAY